MPQDFDLTPTPRVLQMLGEINLPQWRCLAELIDNGIDGFVSARRAGIVIDTPTISITTTRDDDNAYLAVKDNGPGMSADQLEKAAKAGWSGNDPLSSLGLFGMGFNIATARLALVTEVWTTQVGDTEWVGVRIDLDELRRSGKFRAPRQTRPKLDPSAHGSEVVLTRLKPDQRSYLARPTNLKTIRGHLSRTYSCLLQGVELENLRITLNGARIEARRHCIWDQDREVEISYGSKVKAVQTIDVQLAPRRYCKRCMSTLAADASVCPTASHDCEVVEVPRRIWGWLGVQRYFHETQFGIDLIRNGRKIEIGSKDLFTWSDGENSELEYPIDDPRNRGRIVGEIHLDHCRVSYTKDRFERDDPAWEEMVHEVRGDGPLLPIKAKRRGYTDNSSPLYKLFQAFRRSSPQGKNALWSRILAVRDNERSQQMAEYYANNDPEYLTDERWWQLVEEQDRQMLAGPAAGSPSEMGSPQVNIPDGFLDPSVTPAGDGAPIAPSSPSAAPPPRRQLHELTRKYIHPTYRVEFEIQCLAVDSGDPELPLGTPWILRLEDVATRTYAFLVNVDDEVFHSTTMTPLDALLTELTYRTVDFLKDQAGVSLAAVLADFRRQYSGETRLDPQNIIALADNVLDEIARGVASRLPPNQGQPLFDQLTPRERESVTRHMAHRGVPNHREVIAQGRFLEYSEPQSIRAFFNQHPDLFFDGKYWDDPFTMLDFGSELVTAEARDRVKSQYDAYLVDAVWLANQAPSDLDRADRDALIRALCSLRLLRPDVV